MKTLNTIQYDKILYNIVDMIIENNPEYEERDDKIYDILNEYGLLEIFDGLYEYLDENMQ